MSLSAAIWDFLLVINNNLSHLAPFLRYGNLLVQKSLTCCTPFHLPLFIGVTLFELRKKFLIF